MSRPGHWRGPPLRRTIAAVPHGMRARTSGYLAFGVTLCISMNLRRAPAARAAGGAMARVVTRDRIKVLDGLVASVPQLWLPARGPSGSSPASRTCHRMGRARVRYAVQACAYIKPSIPRACKLPRRSSRPGLRAGTRRGCLCGEGMASELGRGDDRLAPCTRTRCMFRARCQ